MICEMCGKDAPCRAMMVQGAKLNLCPNCSRFGDSDKRNVTPGSNNGASYSGSNNAIIQERLEKRERRMQTRDIYSANGGVELIADYGEVIRKAREKRGLTAEEFAQSINEKKGTIVKIESQDLVPDDKIIVKLEKALGIKLKEAIKEGGVVGGGQKSQGMTLGNFIKVEKK